MIVKSRRFYTGLIFFIVLILLSLVRVIFAFGIGDKWSDNTLNIVYTLITQIICMGIVPFSLYIILVLKKDNKPAVKVFKDFGYKPPNLIVIILSVVAGAIFFYLTIGIAAFWSTILTIFGYNSIASVGTIYTSVADLILWVIITAMLPGVFEELTHRGLLINTYNESSEGEAILFSALLFAFMHQDIRQFGYALVGGIILAFFFVKSKSIIPPMILHFSNNAISCLLDYSSQAGGKLGALYDNFYNLFDNFFMIFLLLASWVASGVLMFLIIIQIDIITSKKNKTEATWRKGFKLKLKYNKEDTFLYAAMILGGITTIFSLIWSVTR